jgi:type IV pilus assembly protein PilP
MKKYLIYILLVFLTSLNIWAAEDSGEYSFLHIKTQIKNPYELRDPFKRKPAPKKGRTKAKERSMGIFDAAVETRANTIDSFKVIGIMIGKERRALAKPTNGGTETIILKEGMRIGNSGAEVKAILPGGVVVVEKILNVYDQEEYLETVLPISDN